jgi:hypothetical protein
MGRNGQLGTTFRGGAHRRLPRRCIIAARYGHTAAWQVSLLGSLDANGVSASTAGSATSPIPPRWRPGPARRVPCPGPPSERRASCDPRPRSHTAAPSGVAFSIPTEVRRGSARVSQAQQSSNRRYQSLNGQSGLKAGDGGFQVNVSGQICAPTRTLSNELVERGVCQDRQARRNRCACTAPALRWRCSASPSGARVSSAQGVGDSR